jgi:hypothetical protein
LVSDLKKTLQNRAKSELKAKKELKNARKPQRKAEKPQITPEMAYIMPPGDPLSEYVKDCMHGRLPQRGEHVPNDVSMTLVRNMAMCGYRPEEIASVISLERDTLEKHYKFELYEFPKIATTNVASSLYRKAIGGDIAAQIFWMKTKGKWKEGIEIDVNTRHAISLDFSNFDDEQLDWLRSALLTAAGDNAKVIEGTVDDVTKR